MSFFPFLEKKKWTRTHYLWHWAQNHCPLGQVDWVQNIDTSGPEGRLGTLLTPVGAVNPGRMLGTGHELCHREEGPGARPCSGDGETPLGILTLAANWMELEIILLSKIN